jgi:hypothetical protein
MRRHFEHTALVEWVEAMLSRLPPIQRERAIDRIRAMAAEDGLA